MPASGAARGRAQIRAAGAVCWRIRPGLSPQTDPNPTTMHLLMVRSARWGNWSWPKGKLELGEPSPVAAVREVAEETGVRPRLGLPLPGLRYVIGDGRSKQVDYWVGHVDEHRTGVATAGPEEIADVEWVPADEAIGRLEWTAEAAPATQLFRLAAVDRLRTTSLQVVRHAKARSRSSWDGGEADRPLTAAGRRQADGPVPLLACWEPGQVLTSPWLRCLQTVVPYTAAGGPEPKQLALLTEDAARDSPRALAEAVADLVDGGANVALCTHRPVLAGVVTVLRAAATGRTRGDFPPADPWLRPGEVLVAHQRPGGGEVITVERHRPSRHSVFVPSD